MTYPKLLRPWLLALAIAPLSAALPAEAILDFTRPDAARGFRVINDGVMGGVSSSRLDFAADGMLFTGTVSMENNGGFASFRGPLRVPAGARALAAPTIVLGEVQTVGLLIADKQVGAFRIEVRSIGAE